MQYILHYILQHVKLELSHTGDTPKRPHKTGPDTATNRKEPDMATKETPTMAEALALLQTELGARPIGHDQLLTIG